MLDRAAGITPLLRVLFSGLARRLDIVAADGFTGDLGFAVLARDGDLRQWTIAVRADRAIATPGAPASPALTVRTSRADLLRLAARELDAGRALLDGRLDLEGDF